MHFNNVVIGGTLSAKSEDTKPAVDISFK